MNTYGIIDPRQGSSTPPSWYKDECDLFEYLMTFNDEPFCCPDDRDNFLCDAIRAFNMKWNTDFPATLITLAEFRLFNEKHAVTK